MKESTKWYWKYKLLDLKIKGLNKAWKISDIPWRITSRIDIRRAKGLAWDDPKVAPMMKRGFDAVNLQMARTKRLLPMVKCRSNYYIKYLDTKYHA